jgi:hypothetical protein
VSASLSREGVSICWPGRPENNTGATLVLDANFYLDARTHEKRLRLQGKCQLAELPSAGITWETDDNGLWWPRAAKRRPPPTAMTAMAIRWVKPPWPKMSVLRWPPRRRRIRAKNGLHRDQHLQRSQLGNVRQTCDYDSHDNPVDCELQVIDESVQPPLTRHYTIKNSIEYY